MQKETQVQQELLKLQVDYHQQDIQEVETQICIFQKQVILTVMIAAATGWRGPSAYDSSNVCFVCYDGYVDYSLYHSSSLSARPVVSIPRSKVNINVNGTGNSATLSLNKVTQ